MRQTSLLLLMFVLAGIAKGQSSVDAPKSESSSEADKFTFSSADAKPQPDENTQLTKDEDEAIVIFETILKGDKEIPNNEAIIITTDDDDDDDDVDDSDDEEDEIDEVTSSDIPKSQASDMQIRRQGDVHPEFGRNDGDSSPQQRQAVNNPNQYPSPYDTDNSPLLRLTQGGYQRPYTRRLRYDIPRQRAGSSPQQSETAERPVEVQQGQPQIVPQVTYTSAYQPQMDNAPMFYNPFETPGPFIDANSAISSGAPNGFFNAQQSPYTGFTLSNIQSPFSPSSNGYSDASRDPNPFSQYQAPSMANPSPMFNSPPQFVQTQGGLQRPAQNLFQTPSFFPYGVMSNAAESPRPDYSTYFRSPPAMNLPQFQGNPNFYNALPNSAAFNNPTMNFQSDLPGSSRFLRYPGGQTTSSNTDQQNQKHQQNSETVASEKKVQDSDQISVSPDKEDPVSVPFGTRIQSDVPQSVGPRDVYIRYPMKEAGYATEENLPVQNATDTVKTNDASSFPFLAAGRSYPGFSNPDPYRNALSRLHQGNEVRKTEEGNGTKPVEEFAPFTRETTPQYRRYPVADPFYAPDAIPSSFVLPERYPFVSAPRQESEGTPACAKDANATLCFKDPEYPRRELLYALNSDSFLLDRLVLSDQQRLDGIPLVGEEKSSGESDQDNYVCKSELQYGTPLRARNVQGKWKVVVNIEGAIGGGKFIQPVRTEICRASGDPCSLATDIRTRCVQKYSLQRLLSWSPEKGVHNDVFRLPVACSCQLMH